MVLIAGEIGDDWQRIGAASRTIASNGKRFGAWEKRVDKLPKHVAAVADTVHNARSQIQQGQAFGARVSAAWIGHGTLVTCALWCAHFINLIYFRLQVHQEEFYLQLLQEKDNEYNALVKKLKDRVINLEHELEVTQRRAGIPVALPYDSTSLKVGGPISLSHTGSTKILIIIIYSFHSWPHKCLEDLHLSRCSINWRRICPTRKSRTCRRTLRMLRKRQRWRGNCHRQQQRQQQLPLLHQPKWQQQPTDQLLKRTPLTLRLYPSTSYWTVRWTRAKVN